MNAGLTRVIPVLPSADIARDVRWYAENTGFQVAFADTMYAVLYRDQLSLHLQWHADTDEDPLLGGSVVRIIARPLAPILEEFIRRGVVSRQDYRVNTPWGTNEFGFFDLNKNLIFIMEEVESS
jgi:hypothetical protein